MIKYIKMLKKYKELKVSSKKYMILLFITVILIAGFRVALPYLAALIITYITEKNYDSTIITLVIFSICYLLYYVVYHYNYKIFTKHAIYTHNALQKKILKKLSSIDEDYSKDMSESFLSSTSYNDIGEVVQIPDQAFNSIKYAIILIFSIVIIFTINIYFGICTLIIVISYLIILNYHLDKRDYYLNSEIIYRDKTGHLLGQVLEGEKEIQAFDMSDNLKKHLFSINKGWSNVHFNKMDNVNKAEILDPAIISIFKIIIYTIMTYLIMKGQYGIGILVLIISYVDTVIDDSDELFQCIDLLSSNRVRLNRINKILKYKNKHEIDYGEYDNDNIKGEVIFKNVYFDYENDNTLKNVSFEIAPHSFTVIAGKSGAGKSTIFKILLRLYKIKQGKVLIDGVNIYDYNKDVYSSNVSVATQKPFIFDMSIRENFNLIDSNFRNQVRACKKVGIHDIIMSLPDGYNTKIGKDGSNISFANKQLIALARTLLSKAEILLFDEVTASLDEKTSNKILKLINELKKKHTVIMITHKKNIMRKADKIIVVNNGKIVAIGKHRELLENSKTYYNLTK